MIIDTHAHYDDEAFDQDRELLIEELMTSNIEYIVDIAASIDSPDKVLSLVDRYPFFYGAIGIHPSDTKYMTEEIFLYLKQKLSHEKIVAVGEIGLDYYWDKDNKSEQILWFERQMELAKGALLPIIIHSRDAAKDTYETMKSSRAEEIGGVIHCFSYGVEEAKKYLDWGFFLGIGGVLTFNNAKRLKEVVSYAPIEQLVMETDCPYLAPVPNRGKRNDSRNLEFVATEIAKLKGITKEEVIQITNKNAKQLYQKLPRQIIN